MLSLRRACLVLGCLGSFAAAGLLAQPAGALVGTAQDNRPAEFTDAITLPVDRQNKQKLEAAAELIQEGAYGQAALVLQSLLDAKEDTFFQAVRQGAGGPTTHWVSVRAEASRLLGGMPAEGMQTYQVQYGAAAKGLLEKARQQADPELLALASERYFYTDAGAEATGLLATYHLDRGRYLTAALCYERLLQRLPADQVSPLTLLKATLAFRRSGNQPAADATWKRLAAKVGREGLRVGDQPATLAQLHQELERLSLPDLADPYNFPVFRGSPNRNAQGRGSTPYLEKIWQETMLPEMRDQGNKPRFNIATAQALLRDVAEATKNRPDPMLPTFFPIVADGKVICRSHLGVHAFEIKTGELIWASDCEASLVRITSDTLRYQQGPALTQWLNLYKQGNNANLLLENSTIGSLTTDGQHVYGIDDLPLPPHPNNMQAGGGWAGGQLPTFPGELGKLVAQNRLFSLHLTSGKLEWELTDLPDKEERKPCYFLGPPLPLGGKVYVLAEQQGELKLACLTRPREEPGRFSVVWTQTLAQVRDKLHLDAARRVQAVHLSYGEGILVCPTNAGAVLGVDLLTHSLLWAYPYREGKADPTPEPGFRRRFGQFNIQLQSAEWKVSAPIILDGKVVFTAPDGASIHCINLRDGTALWKASREDDLFLAGVFKGKVLLIGKNYSRALNLADGKAAWKVETGTPAGQGVASDNIYYLPLKKAEVAALDIEKGIVVARARTRKAEDPDGKLGNELGNLLFADGTVVAQNAHRVVAFPQLKVRLAEIDDLLRNDARDPTGLIDRGELKLDQGDLTGAAADLRAALASNPKEAQALKARDKLYDTLTEMLRRDFKEGEPYLNEYRKLCDLPVPAEAADAERGKREERKRERLAGYHVLVAKGREAQGRTLEAFQSYLDFGALAESKKLINLVDDPSIQAQPAIWAQARIAALVAKATPEQRKPLEEEIARRWQKVQDDKNLEAHRQFVTAFGNLFAVGRQAQIRLAERLMETNEPGHLRDAETQLIRLVNQKRDNEQTAGQATEVLARLMLQTGKPDAAAYYYRILGRDYARVVIRDDKTGAELYEELTVDPRLVPYLDEAEPNPLARRVEVREEQGNYPVTQGYFAFEPQGEAVPFFRQLRLVYSNNSSQLKLLDRDSGEERWSHAVARTNAQYLTGTPYPLGGTAPPPRVPYHLIGHLMVVNVGHMVYAFDLAERKELWKRSFFGTDPQQQHMLQLDGDGGLVLAQPNGTLESLGRLGPVTAAYVCLLTREGLVALDPVKGEVLWSKSDVSARTQVFGDDKHVFLVDVRNDGSLTNGRALRSQDGAPVAVPDFAPVYQRRQRLLGGRILANETDPAGGLTVRLYDILTGKDLWRQKFPAGSVHLRSEVPALTGVVEPNGRVTAYDLEARKEVLSTELYADPAKRKEHLNKVNDGLLLQDGAFYYVALNRPPENVRATTAVNLYGMRAAPVNGTVYAFERDSGKIHWFFSAPNQMVLLEQFEALPIVVFSARSSAVNLPAGVAAGLPTTNEAATQTLNKTTGKLIHQVKTGDVRLGQFYSLHVDRSAGTIELTGMRQKVRYYLDDAADRYANETRPPR